MDELIRRLEHQIKKFVAEHDKLKDYNQMLNNGKSMLAHEKDTLLTKQKQAIAQIQTLLSRLKTIEESYE